jgi:hypothetical protein
MDRIASAAGARVVVHDFHFKPLPDEEGFSVAPGYTTAISLQKVLQEKESILKKKINLPQLAYMLISTLALFFGQILILETKKKLNLYHTRLLNDLSNIN